MTGAVERQHGRYVLSTDPARVDVEAVHRYLSVDAYWALGRDLAVVRRSLRNSALVGGAYDVDGSLVAFGRMVTDLATFAWLCDVFVLPDHRAGGLGAALVAMLVDHPDVVGVKRQLLATNDAHDLYRRFGFGPLATPERWLQRAGPGA